MPNRVISNKCQKHDFQSNQSMQLLFNINMFYFPTTQFWIPAMKMIQRVKKTETKVAKDTTLIRTKGSSIFMMVEGINEHSLKWGPMTTYSNWNTKLGIVLLIWSYGGPFSFLFNTKHISYHSRVQVNTPMRGNNGPLVSPINLNTSNPRK